MATPGRGLALAALSVGIVLAIASLVLVMIQAWPFQPDNAFWRFGTVRILARSLPIVAVGALLVVAGVHWMARPRLTRVLSLGAGVIAGATGMAAALFARDYLVLLPGVRPGAAEAFRAAGNRTLLLLIACGIVTALGGIVAWRRSHA